VDNQQELDALADRLERVEEGLKRMADPNVAAQFRLTADAVAESIRNLGRLRDELRQKLGLGAAGPVSLPAHALPPPPAPTPAVNPMASLRPPPWMLEPPKPPAAAAKEDTAARIDKETLEVDRRSEAELRRIAASVAKVDATLKAPAPPPPSPAAQQAGLGGQAQAAFAATAAVGAGAFGLAGIAGAMSALPTFKASVEGLAIAVGEQFVPAMDRASEWLQRAERGFYALDPSVKQAIGTMGMSAIAVTAAAMAWRALVPPLLAAGKALLGLTALAVANPWITLGVAVAGTAAAYLLLRDNASAAADALGKAAEGKAPAAAAAPRDLIAGREFTDLSAAAQARLGPLAGKPAEFAAGLGAELEKARTAYEELRRSSGAATAAGAFRSEAFATVTARHRDPFEAERDRLLSAVQFAGEAEKEAAREKVAAANEAARASAAAELSKAGVAATAAEVGRAIPLAGRPVFPEADAGAQARAQRLLDAQKEVARLESLQGRLGGPDALKRDFRLPPSTIADPMAVYDRLQTAAMNLSGQEKTTDNLLKQIEIALGATNGLLQDISVSVKEPRHPVPKLRY